MFYHLFQRVKLNPADLAKIAKKYGKKPESMISDLSRKYNYWEIPNTITLENFVRLLSIYEIPESYSVLMRDVSDVENLRYDAKIDIYSANFDGGDVIKRKLLLGCGRPVERLDNLSKVTHLIPGLEGDHKPLAQPVEREIKPSRSSTDVHTTLNSIADIAMRPTTFLDNRTGMHQTLDSPLAMLNVLMSRRIRARILIRRRGGVRAFLNAYITAFDRHFNMLLADVDEEYVTNQQTVMAPSSLTPQIKNTFKRHVAQMLLRGDTVVLVHKY